MNKQKISEVDLENVAGGVVVGGGVRASRSKLVPESIEAIDLKVDGVRKLVSPSSLVRGLAHYGMDRDDARELTDRIMSSERSSLTDGEVSILKKVHSGLSEK